MVEETTQPDTSVYEKIITLLQQNGVSYRLVEHEPEGRTDVISRIRGNVLSQAAKAMVVMVKIGKKERRYYLAVIPGDCRVNLDSVKLLCNGTHALFAPQEVTEQLTGCVIGAIPPFSFNEKLHLVVDPLLLEHNEIVFNAGKLDCSLFIQNESYVRISHPTVASIAQP